MAEADIHTCRASLLISVYINANTWDFTVHFVKEKVIWTVANDIKNHRQMNNNDQKPKASGTNLPKV